ncbi:pectinesterase family protein [Streptomyces sp. NBC_00582]|uniref:pectinesterase family protein n=1 Tax=Streptomyces sp. NBC_00582 TaxID=2975783 RepID=UPI002E80B64D|nr:pectinesterase family protein [Streptomyces sp. NBC_00582]WUB67556.1 pectinesterase family protein [Streptomyces sp. NBC_00582]
MTTVMLAIFATLLGPLGVLQSASAATGADVTWRLSSEPDEAKNDYAATINAIRTAISGNYRQRAETDSGTNGPAVDFTLPGGVTDYISVDLHAEDSVDFIRVFIRRSDSYVMGWRQGVENGVGDVTLGQIFPLESDVTLPGTATDRSNVNTAYVGLSNYNDLAQQGATRDGMQISVGSLNNAVLTLQAGDNSVSGYVRVAAPAILQIIEALAEGARFRNQAAGIAAAFGNSQGFTVTPQYMDQQNNWASASTALVAALGAMAVLLPNPVSFGGVTFVYTAALARVIMMAYEAPSTSTPRRKLTEDETSNLWVEPDAFGDYPTIQDAINAVADYPTIQDANNAAPSDGVQHVLVLAKGTYHEAITVPASKRNLFIKGETGNAADVVITADRAHGTINPATGLAYGTEGSAVATFKAPDITVANVTIQNTFNPADHPEVDAYSTQAVAVAAEGDRQTFTQDRIISRQDTILAKAPVATGQYRQYFVGSYIEGSIDFIFGNATAVFDRDNIAMRNWVGGTVLAPNTDWRQKYGILITGSHIYTNGVPANTMYLGRPWHNTADAWPQAVVRDTVVDSGITSAHPWTDMTSDYPWSWARFKEYNNSGTGAGVGTNAPKMTSTEAADYTAQKYLAGTDGWNPVH